ncbi:MAG: hypothetical protein C3F06_04960 [Candidatus Methanoperedenaceae archaeon]|nr:MAG: hypothetical protein C3F06_04960 [Candidatus Methanoperedenaceae archaeon]
MKFNTNIPENIVPLTEIKTHVQALIYKEKYVIPWNHIKQQHPNITEQEILNGLIYGLYKSDKKIEGRYVSWSKFTSPVRLIRIVFEIRGIPENEIVHVITAFDED